MFLEKPSVEFIRIRLNECIVTSGCDNERGNCTDNITGGGTVCNFAWANYMCGETAYRLENDDPVN